MDNQEEYTHPHYWVYLNKRFEKGVVLAFCNYCSYVDEEDAQLQRVYEKTQSPDDYKALIAHQRYGGSLPKRIRNSRFTVKRYYDDECLASQVHERPYTFYVLIRVYNTWVTKKKGLKREKWEQKLMTASGRTPMEAARKLKRRIEKKELLPFSAAGSEADDLKKILAEKDARLDGRI